MTDHYETLGVKKNASADDIKKAYRRKAQKAHPDKGGSEDEIKELNAAYAVLSVPDKRERYDAGVEEPAPDSLMQELFALMELVVENCPDVEHIDIFDQARQRINAGIHQTQQAIKEQERKTDKLLKVVKRIRKRNGDNYLSQSFAYEVKKLAQSILRMQVAIERAKQLLTMIDEYEYEVDKSMIIRTNDSTTIFGRMTGFGQFK